MALATKKPRSGKLGRFATCCKHTKKHTHTRAHPLTHPRTRIHGRTQTHIYCFTRTRSKTVEEPSAADSEVAAAASLNVNVATRWLTLVQGHTKKTSAGH